MEEQKDFKEKFLELSMNKKRDLAIYAFMGWFLTILGVINLIAYYGYKINFTWQGIILKTLPTGILLIILGVLSLILYYNPKK